MPSKTAGLDDPFCPGNGYRDIPELFHDGGGISGLRLKSFLMPKVDSVPFPKNPLYNSIKDYRNVSAESVEETMSKMDELNRTSFKKWIKDEQNVHYLCVTKKDLILGYIERDVESAMYALEWMIEGWSVETIAELILKLFYSHGLKSEAFCCRVYRMVYQWEMDKVFDLLSILLVGESSAVVAQFFGNWIQQSDWNCDQLTDLIVPLVESYKWNSEQMGLFLVSLSTALVDDPNLRHSLAVIIHSELELAIQTQRKIIHYFELLLQIVIEESHVLEKNHCK
jgi:hypothetical protein